MTTQPTVRRIREGEGAVLRAIRLRALDEDPTAFGTTLEAARRYGDNVWTGRAATASEGGEQAVFLAEVDGMIEAMVGAYVSEDETVATLYGMWLAPALRGSGAAESLVAAVEEWATTNGFNRIELCVYEHNAPAVRFYTRLGYRTTENTAEVSANLGCGRELIVLKDL